MAVSSAMVWEFRATATASMVNGGGFKAGATGVDYSQQDTAQYQLTGVTSAGAGNTILHASATADMVGNVIHTVSGTNFTNNQWFEITSIIEGVSITCSTNAAGTAISVGVGADGVMNIGGALSLNSTLDDEFFEQVIGGNTIYMKNGSYTLGEAVSVASTSSTTTAPITMIGYNSSRGDNPAGSSRPSIACGSNSFGPGVAWILKHIIFTGSAASVVVAVGNSLQIHFCKSTNDSGVGNRAAFSTGSTTLGTIHFSEGISTAGRAFSFGQGQSFLYGCYGHDSDMGCIIGGSDCAISFCVFENNVTAAIDDAVNGGNIVTNCTLYGSESKTGVGILMASTVAANNYFNNIIYGFVTGISQDTSQKKSNRGAYNDFYNNTANASNYTLDGTDLTLDPVFTNASGHDFSIGTNLKAAGFPGLVPGSGSISYLDIGAVQRQEVAAGGWFSGE